MTELAADLDRHGGALVVLKWQQGKPTLVYVLLPDDEVRQGICRRLSAITGTRILGIGGGTNEIMNEVISKRIGL